MIGGENCPLSYYTGSGREGDAQRADGALFLAMYPGVLGLHFHHQPAAAGRDCRRALPALRSDLLQQPGADVCSSPQFGQQHVSCPLSATILCCFFYVACLHAFEIVFFFFVHSIGLLPSSPTKLIFAFLVSTPSYCCLPARSSKPFHFIFMPLTLVYFLCILGRRRAFFSFFFLSVLRYTTQFNTAFFNSATNCYDNCGQVLSSCLPSSLFFLCQKHLTVSIIFFRSFFLSFFFFGSRPWAWHCGWAQCRIRASRRPL